MTIKVLYFAMLRDLLGRAEECLVLPEGFDLRALAETLGREHPRLKERLAGLAWGVNFEYARLDTVLRDGDEVALLPPVSGGRR